jgi:2-oxoglutarate/2-oxoacid ferredoxin oxidoreductase subunit alpha
VYNYFMLTIGIGGAAGEGVKYTGIDIGNFLCGLGYQIYLSVDYPSLIRGGHNFVRLSTSKEKIWNDYSKLDILVCLNEETKELHNKELKEGALILEGLKNEEILAKIKEFLKEKNLATSAESSGVPKELIDGNTAFSKGLQAAGLDFYISYPMTPATSILHYLASRQKKDGLKVIQPENEIAAINMALGAVYAGKRAAVGTATGGFALMQEAFSFSGMAELPLVVAVAQRQAPATGVPTRSSQSDLRFVIHAGHGEFPRIVLAPGDPEECFRCGAEALNLAWKFRMPVIVLLDKILSEHMMTSVFDTVVPVEKNENIIFPGTPEKVVKITSYEHGEDGITVDRPKEVKVAMDRRFAKGEEINKEMQNRETVKIFGDTSANNVIVFFGSTKGPVLEAAKYFEKQVKLVQIIWLEPFDTEKIKKELGGAKKIICVEGNHSGQLASLIRERTGIEVTDKILRYDSSPFDPEELAEEINNKIS